jgi:two-component system response regulator DevR
MIRVFLLDDHEVVRRGVRELLETADGIEVVGEASTADEALRRVPALRPDVAVLDVRLGDGNGIEVCRELRNGQPELRCLMLTSFDEDEALFNAIVAGASGYVLKDVRGTDLIDAIRRAAAGESLLDPRAAAMVIERLRNPKPADERLSALTQQEQRILGLLAEGLSNRQIAERMYLAEKTIKNYVSNLLLKLGMSRRTEAAVYAARLAERTRPRPDR